MTADPEQHDQMASTTASLARLRQFRAGFHSRLTGWGDALFELGEALLTAPGPVASVPALSLEPVFRRSHGSLYKALARGGVDDEQIRDLLVAHRPRDWPDVFAVDASTWARCDAETSPGRGFYYCASKHSAGQPIVAGWSYQWVTQLSWASDSWTAPVDMRRAEPADDATTMTATQVRELTARLAPSRFDIEHTYRFVKNTLGWTTPRICTPEQADTWTWTIIAAYTQLRLARGLVEDHRLPWERPRPPERLTPGRVRRGFRRLGPLLGTPASPPKPSRAGPGRPKNTPTGPRVRHPAIKKSA